MSDMYTIFNSFCIICKKYFENYSIFNSLHLKSNFFFCKTKEKTEIQRKKTQAIEK